MTGTNAYDNAFNPTTLRGTSGLSYNDNNQRTPSTGVWAYDGMGNPTTYRGRTNTYDLPGRMATTRDGNNWSVGYTYRADGLMASRAKTIYVQMFGQWQPVTSAPTYYLHDGGEPVLEMSLTSNSSTVNAINVRGPDGLVARRQNGDWVYYEFDAQGSVSQRLDASGNVISSSVYDAYGAETNAGTPTDPFGYNAQWGYWLDRDTGLDLCQARWYDPVTARWVTRDPIGYAGGANLYGYCGGGPVGAGDPEGLAKVVLRYRRVGGPFYRAFITVSGPGRKGTWAISGGPAIHWITPGGKITIYEGPFDKTSYDFHPADMHDESVILVDDCNSADYWIDRLIAAGNRLAVAGHLYELTAKNSNSVARELLESAGIKAPNRHPVWVPAWQNDPWGNRPVANPSPEEEFRQRRDRYPAWRRNPKTGEMYYGPARN